jgi:hypothetical protein
MSTLRLNICRNEDQWIASESKVSICVQWPDLLHHSETDIISLQYMAQKVWFIESFVQEQRSFAVANLQIIHEKGHKRYSCTVCHTAPSERSVTVNGLACTALTIRFHSAHSICQGQCMLMAWMCPLPQMLAHYCKTQWLSLVCLPTLISTWCSCSISTTTVVHKMHISILHLLLHSFMITVLPSQLKQAKSICMMNFMWWCRCRLHYTIIHKIMTRNLKLSLNGQLFIFLCSKWSP